MTNENLLIIIVISWHHNPLGIFFCIDNIRGMCNSNYSKDISGVDNKNRYYILPFILSFCRCEICNHCHKNVTLYQVFTI